MGILNKISLDLGINIEHLTSLSRNTEKYYARYTKRKSSGSLRIINAPGIEIKAIQAYILKRILEKIGVSEYVHGFVKGRGIKSNATMHKGQKHLLCIDIKDFFPSINARNVTAIFEAISGIDKADASILSRFCTYNGRLPQGGVTSPYISNIALREADERIAKICNAEGVNYTRYADDLSFSSNRKEKLISILSQVSVIIEESGFQINSKKTRFLSGKGRKSITGIILNEKGRMTTGRNRKRLIRSMMHRFIAKKDTEVNLKYIIGNLAFIDDIEPGYLKKFTTYSKRLVAKAKAS